MPREVIRRAKAVPASSMIATAIGAAAGGKADDHVDRFLHGLGPRLRDDARGGGENSRRTGGEHVTTCRHGWRFPCALSL